MAEEKKAEAQPTEEASGGGKLPLKTIIVAVVLMAVEGGALFFVLGSKEPTAASADVVSGPVVSPDSPDATREIQIVDDRFQNLTTGKAWMWEISVFIKVKNKNADVVNGVLTQRKNEIQQGIARIVGRASHLALTEPDLQTLTRQIKAFLAEVFGGEELYEDVIIPKCRGMTAGM